MSEIGESKETKSVDTHDVTDAIADPYDLDYMVGFLYLHLQLIDPSTGYTYFGPLCNTPLPLLEQMGKYNSYPINPYKSSWIMNSDSIYQKMSRLISIASYDKDVFDGTNTFCDKEQRVVALNKQTLSHPPNVIDVNMSQFFTGMLEAQHVNKSVRNQTILDKYYKIIVPVHLQSFFPGYHHCSITSEATPNKYIPCTTLYFDKIPFFDILGKCMDPKNPLVIKYTKNIILYLNNLKSLTVPKLQFIKHDEKAVTPTKATMSDVGWDLTVIKRYHPKPKPGKYISKNLYMYDTGISIVPPDGFSVDVLPRSSLSTSGFVLANSVGIIDPSYTGTFLIALIKHDSDAPDLELPFKGFQMVVRKVYYTSMVEKVKTDLVETIRGAGGFGSSDEKKV